MKTDNAFSGLEAAIVLIAFVVVAAVFSYVMLGAGFFATQKSQEVTYSGIKQATSNLVLDGTIYGTMNAAGTQLDSIDFTLAIPEGGQAQDLTQVSFLFAKDTGDPAVIGTGQITLTRSGTVLTDTVLTPGTKVDVNIDSLAGPATGGSFSLEIKPLVGASNLITKTLGTGYEGGPIN